MSDPCQICDYSYNQTKRKRVECPYCNFASCKTCCETYVLGESSVKCMNTSCGREWTRQFMRSAFSATFIGGKLKKHREQLLFDNERALLPATQPLVERVILRGKLSNRCIEITQLIRDLKIEQRNVQISISNLIHNEAPVERTEFIRNCPDQECRGFLSTQWKCGICEKWACNMCHEIKGLTRDAPHECNPETVATVSLLANDTKPCPNCRTGIFKINGCDQMWCTQCHTAFNWRTGRIESNVHNPHYFEWLRRNGNNVPRNPGDIPCQQNELRHVFVNEFRRIVNEHENHPLRLVCIAFIDRLVQNTLHMRYTLMSRHAVPVNRERINESLRINYMMNHITENDFKSRLQRDDKKYSKNREIHNVLEILLNTITDILFRFSLHVGTARMNSWVLDILEEIDPIVDYVNECLRDISKTYSSKLIQFSNEMRIK